MSVDYTGGATLRITLPSFVSVYFSSGKWWQGSMELMLIMELMQATRSQNNKNLRELTFTSMRLSVSVVVLYIIIFQVTKLFTTYQSYGLVLTEGGPDRGDVQSRNPVKNLKSRNPTRIFRYNKINTFSLFHHHPKYGCL